ncbi:MAG: ABC transporter permease [Candidatus Marinimicrobia bacterium]|nr:ABC transporter permease [Candidatus Neomarinimicrobiota bacterium]
MLAYYFKIALRNIKKYRGYSIINITGLAVGMACSILILIYVNYELSFDTFHANADRIYRVAINAMGGGTKINQTYSSAATFNKLLEDFPEIEYGVKFLNLGEKPIIHNEMSLYESGIFAVDSTFFNIFSFPLIHGDHHALLNAPNTIVLTKNTALKYFNHTDVVGEILTIDLSSWGYGNIDFKITGVTDNVPANSHFHYNLLLSIISFPDQINKTGWTANNFITYLLLYPGSSQVEFEKKLAEFTRVNMGGERFDDWVAQGNYWEYFLQPLTDIHLNSDLNGEFEPNGNKTYVYIFLVICVIILLIACINFMNLSTAKSSLRAREVGIKKVVGSNRRMLVRQFLTESVIMSYISLGLGIFLVELILNGFGNLIGQQLEIHYFDNLQVIPLLLLLGLVVGVVSGSYPAFVLSSFQPVMVLKGNTGNARTEVLLRNILVLFQFGISISVIIGTLIVFKQLDYFMNKELGFDKENVLVISNPGDLGQSLKPLKESLLRHSNILSVSGSNTLPGKSFSNIGFGAEGVESYSLNTCVCDYEFIETLKLNLIKGRFFSRDFPSDSSAVVINEKAAKLLGWENPIGKQINNWSSNTGNFTIVGVIRDYHYESLHQVIRPQGLFLSGGYYKNNENNISLRYVPENVPETINFIRSTWNGLAPGKTFDYSFLNDDYEALYMNEQQTRTIFIIFSILATFIACLGLFGLASFMADQRTKEIGIRKVLGASVTNLIMHFSFDFSKWVLLANLIAWPVTYYFISRWLDNFAYRTTINWRIFLLSGSLALLIALLTVSYQAVKIAMANPVDSLKYE